MKVRSEEEKISRTAVMVKLGDLEYPIHPPRRGKARLWREKVVTTVNEIMGAPEMADISSEVLFGAFRGGVSKALLNSPDKLAELLKDLAPEITDEILDWATEEQIGEAFSAAFKLGFPHLAELGRLTQVARASGPSLSRRFVN